MSYSGMSLPGLSMTAPPPASAPATIGHKGASSSTTADESVPRLQELAPGTEYRFEVAFNARPVTVRLVQGLAECFGTELASNTKEPYTFGSGTRAAIYTWHGCRLLVDGDVESEYRAEATPMGEYANVHFALEKMRDDGARPRVLLVGPHDAGKTSLARLLTAYALKMDRQPVVVNLDPRQGMLGPPGSLVAATFASRLDVDDGWGSSPIDGPSPVPVKMPLVYHYGLASPDHNPALFRGLVTRLALAVTSRMDGDDAAGVSGCIIDTPGALSMDKKDVYENIQHVISEFSVNAILVLGSERLYSNLSRRSLSTDERPVHIVMLDKSGGCVDRDEVYMKALRQAQVRSYFFGHASVTLSPHTLRVGFDSLHIFRTVDTSASNPAASFLPGGDGDGDDHDHDGTLGDRDTTRRNGRLYSKIKPSLMIQNALLAITDAEPTAAPETIRDSSVMGYVYVADIDEARRSVRLLVPMSGQVPRKAMIMGNWPEDVPGLVG